MQKVVRILTLSLIGLVIFSSFQVWASPVPTGVAYLPDPNTPIYVPGTTTPIAGEYLATRYDDFYAYSTALNAAVLGTSIYDYATGTGQNDLLLFTGAGGADNDPVSGGFSFQDPLASPSGGSAGADSFEGLWGAGAATGTIKNPVLVQNLLSYLQTFDPNNTIPVFAFDMGEPGSGAASLMSISGEVRIWDPVDGYLTGAAWALDLGTDDGLYEPGNPIYIPGTLQIGPHQAVDKKGNLQFDKDGNPVIEYYYEVDTDRGGGKADYLAYAPGMDLSLYADADNQFRTYFKLEHLDGTFEELFLTGALAPQGNPVPEPASLALLGVGLFGLLGFRKRS